MFTIKKFRLYALKAFMAMLILSNPAKSQIVQKGISNIVLVHGAFADGSSWADVVSVLQVKGYHVAAVQNPLTSLEDDVAATQRAIALMDGPVLLVGHSWAGMVISVAGNDPKVAGLMYISALIPDDTQNVADLSQHYPAAPGGAELRPDASGYLSLTRKGIEEDFGQDLPAAKRSVLFSTQGPWAASSTTQKVYGVAWKNKPSWVIVATNDRMISPELERAEAKMIKATTIELTSSHVPMVSQPDKVAAFIVEAAQNLPTK